MTLGETARPSVKPHHPPQAPLTSATNKQTNTHTRCSGHFSRSIRTWCLCWSCHGLCCRKLLAFAGQIFPAHLPQQVYERAQVVLAERPLLLHQLKEFQWVSRATPATAPRSPREAHTSQKPQPSRVLIAQLLGDGVEQAEIASRTHGKYRECMQW